MRFTSTQASDNDDDLYKKKNNKPTYKVSDDVNFSAIFNNKNWFLPIDKSKTFRQECTALIPVVFTHPIEISKLKFLDRVSPHEILSRNYCLVVTLP